MHVMACRRSRSSSARASRPTPASPRACGIVLVLFAADGPELLALIEADRLGQLRTGAASAVAARHLAAPGATDARAHRHRLAGGEPARSASALRCPGSSRSSPTRRNEERLPEFCDRHGCEAGEYNRDAAEQDVVVTITSSRDPVLRGEWLQPGALVCAAGANRIEARELDNAVLERASVRVLRLARAGADRGRRPRGAGRAGRARLARGARAGRGGRGRDRRAPGDDDIVVFKSLGIAAEDVAVAALAYDRARERGRRRRALARGLRGRRSSRRPSCQLAVGPALVAAA